MKIERNVYSNPNPISEIERIIGFALTNAGLDVFIGAGYISARDSRGTFHVSVSKVESNQ